MLTAVVPLVCVVDDDLSVRKSLSRLLTLAGYTVEAFPSAGEFLTREAPEGPCCLVLDVRMPGLTGIEMQEALAAAGRRMSIVFITGHLDVPASVKAMKGGAVDLLTKPIDREELLAAVARAVAKDAADLSDETRTAEIRQRIKMLTVRSGTGPHRGRRGPSDSGGDRECPQRRRQPRRHRPGHPHAAVWALGRLRRTAGRAEHHLGRDDQALAWGDKRRQGAFLVVHDGRRHRILTARLPRRQCLAGSGRKVLRPAVAATGGGDGDGQRASVVRHHHPHVRRDLQAPAGREDHVAERRRDGAPVHDRQVVDRALSGPQRTVASVYGAAGSLIVILLWIYYSAQVVFFGAEFTKVYSRHFGTH